MGSQRFGHDLGTEQQQLTELKDWYVWNTLNKGERSCKERQGWDLTALWKPSISEKESYQRKLWHVVRGLLKHLVKVLFQTKMNYDKKFIKLLGCWEGLGAWEGDDRGWDGWMASLTWWTWVWVDSGSWWWTGRPSVLRFMGLQRARHNWATELNWGKNKAIGSS